MTDRETFERVRTHLLAQGRRAMRPTSEVAVPQCAFRTVTAAGETLHCAVGCLISDELYDPRMEGNLPGSFIVQGALVRAGILPAVGDTLSTEALLLLLMSVHDEARPARWERLLSTLADRKDLWSPEGGYLGESDPWRTFGSETWEEAVRER